MLYLERRSYGLYYIGCWINVCVTHVSSCLPEDKNTAGILRPSTPTTNRGAQGRPATQAPDLLTGEMTCWSWRMMTIHFVQHTGHAAALPRCWHTGETQQHCTGHTFPHLLTCKGTAKDIYTPSQQTSCQSSICKLDLWSHSPLSSYSPKICVTSSDKGPDASKQHHCSCNVIQSPKKAFPIQDLAPWAQWCK